MRRVVLVLLIVAAAAHAHRLDRMLGRAPGDEQQQQGLAPPPPPPEGSQAPPKPVQRDEERVDPSKLEQESESAEPKLVTDLDTSPHVGPVCCYVQRAAGGQEAAPTPPPPAQGQQEQETPEQQQEEQQEQEQAAAARGLWQAVAKPPQNGVCASYKAHMEEQGGALEFALVLEPADDEEQCRGFAEELDIEKETEAEDTGPAPETEAEQENPVEPEQAQEEKGVDPAQAQESAVQPDVRDVKLETDESASPDGSEGVCCFLHKWKQMEHWAALALPAGKSGEEPVEQNPVVKEAEQAAGAPQAAEFVELASGNPQQTQQQAPPAPPTPPAKQQQPQQQPQKPAEQEQPGKAGDKTPQLEHEQDSGVPVPKGLCPTYAELIATIHSKWEMQEFAKVDAPFKTNQECHEAAKLYNAGKFAAIYDIIGRKKPEADPKLEQWLEDQKQGKQEQGQKQQPEAPKAPKPPPGQQVAMRPGVGNMKGVKVDSNGFWV